MKHKKRALRKDFYMEIKTTFNRFLSIFFIVALGVAFFSGIRASEPDMRYSGDAYFDRNRLMDLRVLGTLGVTDDDISALLDIDGVSKVEAGYQTDVLCEINDSQKVVQVISNLPTMNNIDVSDGRMPENDHEVLIDDTVVTRSVYNIGDTVTFKSGTSDDLSDTLHNDTYTIVGFGSSPCFIGFHRGSSTVGTGEISCFMIVTPEAFAQEVYSALYLEVDGAMEMTSFTPEYEDLVSGVLDQVEAVSDARCQARYDGIMADAQSEIDDGQRELDDAKTEAQIKILEAESELADGEQKLLDARETVQNARQELEDGKAELAKQQSTIDSSRAELDDGWSQLLAGQAALNEKEAEYENGRVSGEAQLNEAQASYDALYAQTMPALDAGWEEYLAGVAAYDENRAAYEQGVLALDEVRTQLDGLNQLAAAGMATDEQLAMIPVLEATIAGSEQELAAGEAGLDAALEQLNSAYAELANGYAQLDDGQVQINQAWADYNAQMADARAQLDAGWQELANNEALLNNSEAKLSDGQRQINEAWEDIRNGEQELIDGEQEISDNEQKLVDGRQKLEDAKKEADEKIMDAQKTLDDAREKVADITFPKWYVQDRGSLPEYTGYGENADRMKAIGKVFPVLFFLVAALISLTTMTRMVEEERTQIGTLKALGYSKRAIMSKYVGYAFLATIGGSIFGVLIGEKILPYIIVYSYKIMYVHIPDIVIPYSIYYAVMATVAATFCTVAATLFASFRELSAVPAELMRPAAPKQGKRILLEYLPILWTHLNFTWKSTLRNLIRYKKRFFMTVFGIGGCMALMIVGFGLKDSIFEIAKLQYEQLQTYDGTVILNTDATDDEMTTFLDSVSKDQRLEIYVENYMKQLDLDSDQSEITRTAYLLVPKDLDAFMQMNVFRSRTKHETYTLEDDGVIITEKMAKFLNVKVGDSIEISDGDTDAKSVVITAVCENYMSHYVYMTPALYESLYGKAPEYNSIEFRLSDYSEVMENEVGEDMLTYEAALNVSYSSSISGQLDDMLGSLNIVIVVLIVSAGMLAFVVLYNLNNININERRRELATLKVLGFYDMEVASYVYRENTLLTIVGMLAGIGLGKILHQFIIVTVEIDTAMFGRNVDLSSFVFSALYTLGFSMFVNFVMYYKLKKIDMVESLKSIE